MTNTRLCRRTDSSVTARVACPREAWACARETWRRKRRHATRRRGFPTMPTMWVGFLGTILLLAVAGWSAEQQPDILIADFEGDDYGPWQATGEAFGPGPARGTLPNQ